MTENQPSNPDDTQSTEGKTFDPRDLVSKGGYDKDPREIIENPAVSPQMLDDSPHDGVGMGQGDSE
jgi:hypothetical protein